MLKIKGNKNGSEPVFELELVPIGPKITVKAKIDGGFDYTLMDFFQIGDKLHITLASGLPKDHFGVEINGTGRLTTY